MLKGDLHDLADGLLLNDQGAIDACVEFVLAESEGNWHGRARAMMCRRLKHCELSRQQQSQLVSCIVDRLSTGNFSEQFRDQLRLALHISRDNIVEAARKNLSGSQKDHVRRYCAWIVAHHSATRTAAPPLDPPWSPSSPGSSTPPVPRR
jgi:hypothetical protein